MNSMQMQMWSEQILITTVEENTGLKGTGGKISVNFLYSLSHHLKTSELYKIIKNI